MKKFFLFIVIALAAISVNAQKTTYIAKYGVGVGGDDYGHSFANFGFEVNFPISVTNWTFSPSLHATFVSDEDQEDGSVAQNAVYMPLAFGYKISLGNKWIFRPTLGPMVGYAFENDERHNYIDGGFIAGPVLGLNFENKHFSVGLQYFCSGLEMTYHFDGYYSSKDYDFTYQGAYLTLGYKF